MARIRTIKPEFQQSASMGRVSREARLTFILLWPQCDDAGRARADSRMLASLLFPYDDDAVGMIDRWLSELENENCIVRYEVEGKNYVQIVNWDHQKIDHKSASKFPSPPEKRVKTKRKSREDNASVREPSFLPLEPSPLDQGSRIKEGIKDQVPVPPRATRAEFDEDFWPIYPRKVGVAAALKAFTKARKTAELPAILDGVRRYAASRAGQDEQYTAHAATWLNQERWKDGAAAILSPAANGTLPFNLAELQAQEEALQKQRIYHDDDHVH